MVKVNEYWKYLTRMCVYNARLNVRLRKFNRVKKVIFFSPPPPWEKRKRKI